MKSRYVGGFRFGLLLIISAALFQALPATAGIKCWKNKDGVRECGNVVPPEYAQRETEVKDKHGLTIKKSGPAKTLAALEAEAQKQAALDRVLLDTFSSEDDMVLTRDGQIAHLDSQVRLTQSHVDKLNKNLEQAIERAAELERKGQKPSKELVANIDSLRTQVAENAAFIETKRREQDAIRKRFETDIVRFRELKGVRQKTSTVKN
jgi:hypothetical protein